MVVLPWQNTVYTLLQCVLVSLLPSWHPFLAPLHGKQLTYPQPVPTGGCVSHLRGISPYPGNWHKYEPLYRSCVYSLMMFELVKIVIVHCIACFSYERVIILTVILYSITLLFLWNSQCNYNVPSIIMPDNFTLIMHEVISIFLVYNWIVCLP